MPGSKSFAVLGFRPHTGWTAAVAVTGAARAPDVVDRRRIEFGAAGEERFIYHRTEERPRDNAVMSIAKARKLTEASAERAISQWIAELKARGFRANAAVVPIARTPLPENLDEILAAHSRIHAAEGAFYRDVIVAACAGLKLKVHRVVERDLPGLTQALLPAADASLKARLKEMGTALGPPWSEDQKLATMAAWVQLEGTSARRR